MFGIFKKKEPQILNGWQPGGLAAGKQPEEIMGLKEYISIDSMKAHLVDILEENRKLKAEYEEIRERSRKTDAENRKKYELSAIEADEWKKRTKEAEEKERKLKRDIDRLDGMVEKLQQERNSLITKAEMAEVKLKKEEERRRNAGECKCWLENTLKSYGDWEKITKSQLVEILKVAIRAEDKKQEE